MSNNSSRCSKNSSHSISPGASPAVPNSFETGAHSRGDLDGAFAELREALRLKPDYAEAHYNLGLALNQKGDQDGAIAEYHEALRLKPSDADAHHNLGLGLQQKGDLDGAIGEYREALRLKPDYVEAQLTTATRSENSN